MKTLILLIGMVFIVEGLPYVANPEAMKRWIKTLGDMEPGQLRIMGIVSMVIGLVICWLVQNSGLL